MGFWLTFHCVVRAAVPAVLTNAADARLLDRADIPKAGIPAVVTGKVTFVDDPWKLLTIQDETAGIFVKWDGDTSAFKPGDILRVQGAITGGEFAPSLVPGRIAGITRIGSGAAPEPATPAYRSLTRGQSDAQRIRLNGTLGSTKLDQEYQRITLQVFSEFGEFTAHLSARLRANYLTGFIGSQLELVGVCGTEFNEAGQFVNFNLLVASTNDVRIVGDPHRDPFHLPLRPIREVLSFRNNEDSLSFVHIQGTVTYATPSLAVIQGGHGTIRLRLPAESQKVLSGQLLDVVGIPRPDRFGPTLRACQFKVLSNSVPPPPEELVDHETVHINLQNGRRVFLEGEVTAIASQPGAHVVTITDAKANIIQAVIASFPGSTSLPSGTDSGARVRVVGVFEPPADLGLERTLPRVLVSSPADLRVLAPSPANRIWQIVGFAILGASAGILALAYFINRHLHGQARALQEQQRSQSDLQQRYNQLVEHAVDLIYTLDAQGRVIGWNQAAARFFGRSPERIQGQSVLEVIVPEQRDLVRSRIAQRLSDPDHTAPFTVDVFDASGDRRTLEITSRVVWKDDQPPQVEGVARDITLRRRVEEALRALVATTASGSGEAFFRGVVQCIADTLNVDYAVIAVPSPKDPSTLETLAAWSLGAATPPGPYSRSGSPCADVLAGRSVRIPDRAVERYPQSGLLRAMSTEAYFGLELQANNGSGLGLLFIAHRKPFHPTQYQMQLLEILAARVGAEIERIEMEKRSRTDAEGLRRANSLLLNLNRHHLHGRSDLTGMLDAIAAHAVEGLSASQSSIWLLDPAHETMSCTALSTERGPAKPITQPISVADHPAYFAAIENDRFLATSDGRTDPRTSSFAEPYLIPSGITSMLDAPIRIEGRVVGALCVEHCGPPRTWSTSDTLLVSSLADMAAIALQTDRSAGAERELDRRTRLLQSLAMLSRAMLTVDSWESAVGAVVHGIGPASSADRCYFFARHPSPQGGQDVVSHKHEWCADGIHSELANPQLQNMPFADFFPRWAASFDKGESISGAVRTFPPTEQAILTPQGILSIVILPVMVANRWVGAIGFDSCRSERLWQRYEIDLLTTIAGDLGRSLEQWETKRALQTKEVHYESVVEVLAEGVIVADQRGRFTRSNANASRILGLSAAQLQSADLNSNGWDVIREDGSRMPNHDFPAIRTLQNGEPCTGTIMGVRRPDGDRCWISVNTRPLRDPGASEVTSVVISFVDITESRRNRLELERARDAAEASNRAKADFLTVISHEVRTPLNAVLGYADLLEQELAEADLRRYVRTIRQSGENLLEIINDILDFSKLEAGRLKLENEPYDLLETCFAVADLLAIRAAAKGLTLGFDWHPEVPRHLSGDAGRVRQIVTNLVGNAVKFTHSGQILLSTRVLAADATHPRRIRIQVEDTGPGIPSDKHSLLFQRFSMVDTSLTRRHGGTGLGLAISRQLAEAMGGFVGFSSDPGTGSTFWCDLPIPATSEPSSGGPGAPPGTRLILATQQATASRLILRQCRHWGLEVSTADSATAIQVIAESAAASRPIAAVIRDESTDPALVAVLDQLRLPAILVETPRTTIAARGEAAGNSAATLHHPFIHPDHLARAIDAILSPGSRGHSATSKAGARYLDTVHEA